MSQANFRLVEGTSVDKSKALDAAVCQIERAFGKGSIMNLGKARGRNRDRFDGFAGLDIALGIGGLPRGRIVEIYGPEISGKTTLALHVIAEAQKRAAPAPLSMPNMRSIPFMPASWASISTSC